MIVWEFSVTHHFLRVKINYENNFPGATEDGQNGTPVLFNKYALDREESCRGNFYCIVYILQLRFNH